MNGAASMLPILVAEDNMISRELIVEQLRLLGRDAVACEDGAEALAAWRSGRFAMLLTDLQMPGLDGFALAAAIRSERPDARLPIVALSAGEDGTDDDRHRRADIDETLAKPASLDALRRTIAKWTATPSASPRADVASTTP